MSSQALEPEVMSVARIEPREIQAKDFLPVFDIQTAIDRKKIMAQFIGSILNESTDTTAGDYGVIPGTSKQKVLLKAGAEKLCTFFGLSPRFDAEQITEDWTGEHHGHEPLFYYRYKCSLWRGDRLLGEAVGSCNSREKKYRYREGGRKCPACEASAIINGKKEYGGGFLCFGKKGGCGAKFKADDPAITTQETGQVPNPDLADCVNTIQKMAQKRALVAAVLIATNASDSFTQDMEDVTGEMVEPERGSKSAAEQVADKKLEVLRANADPNNDPPALAEYLRMYREMVPNSIEQCLEHIRVSLRQVDGVQGEMWYEERTVQFGKDKPKKNRKPQDYIDLCKEMWKKVEELRLLKASSDTKGDGV